MTLETPDRIRELQRKLYRKAKRESLRKKMIGKPYSGKLNVRFDEGELEIGHQLLRQLSTLPEELSGINDPKDLNAAID